MKKLIAVLFGLGTFCVAHADEKIISTVTFRIGDVSIVLPKVMTDQGLVCVSYVKAASRNEDKTLSVQIGQYCGKPVSSTNNLSHNEVFLDGLKALVTVNDSDLPHQLPVVTNDKSTVFSQR